MNDSEHANETFKKLNEAYTVLIEDRSRHEYDSARMKYASSFSAGTTWGSNVRPVYNFDGSPFYNFDVWYTSHYGPDVAEMMRRMATNREQATRRQVSSSDGWSSYDAALRQKRRSLAESSATFSSSKRDHRRTIFTSTPRSFARRLSSSSSSPRCLFPPWTVRFVHRGRRALR